MESLSKPTFRQARTVKGYTEGAESSLALETLAVKGLEAIASAATA